MFEGLILFLIVIFFSVEPKMGLPTMFIVFIIIVKVWSRDNMQKCKDTMETFMRCQFDYQYDSHM